ncbi:DUF6017 domain-containing protein [Senegalia sp. (in: firmicutes)]|uniref:DUF6017 domain-containing protein n=1 Tax=Senegalia sp. (in: firmicutes) TaxID=1924098 RepID=UPI003F98C3EC
MSNIYSSGNEVVDQVGQMYFSGNIIPTTWYKTIVRDNKKPYLNAIIILSDVVYWYRPTELRDEQSGQLIGFKKKFRDDLLQRSYQQIADQFGMSKREATNAVVFLEKLGVIEREFRTIKIGSTVLNNVLYLRLNAEVLSTITFERDTLSLHKEGDPTLKRETLSLNEDRPVTLKGETNTKNTTNNSSKTSSVDYYHINQKREDGIDSKPNSPIEKEKEYRDIIKKNIEYEHYRLYRNVLISDIDNLLDLMVDVCIQEKGTVNINGYPKSVEIVRSQFLKINSSHIEYIIDSLHDNPSDIKNIKNYLLTTIYNAVFTKEQFYRSKANYNLYGRD